MTPTTPMTIQELLAFVEAEVAKTTVDDVEAFLRRVDQMAEATDADDARFETTVVERMSDTATNLFAAGVRCQTAALTRTLTLDQLRAPKGGYNYIECAILATTADVLSQLAWLLVRLDVRAAGGEFFPESSKLRPGGQVVAVDWKAKEKAQVSDLPAMFRRLLGGEGEG